MEKLCPVTSKVEPSLTIVYNFQPLSIVRNSSWMLEGSLMLQGSQIYFKIFSKALLPIFPFQFINSNLISDNFVEPIS